VDIGIDVKDQHALSDIETLWKQLLITYLRLPSSTLLGTDTSRIANSGDEDNGEQKDAKIAKTKQFETQRHRGHRDLLGCARMRCTWPHYKIRKIASSRTLSAADATRNRQLIISRLESRILDRRGLTPIIGWHISKAIKTD
jgi:hypothetical protein